MISLKNALCVALIVVPVAGQEATVNVCQGEILAAVSNGCVSADICGTVAQSMGLQLGSDLYPFEADWVDKGCFYFPSDHPLYPNEAYFGIQGSCSQLRISPSEGGVRISCDGTTQAPFDPSRCEGDVCITPEACEATALAMGLQLGNSLYPFEGPWVVKGCVYFPANHPEFPNQAYFGTGADICGQLRASPNDGSIRINCVAGGETATTAAPVTTFVAPVTPGPTTAQPTAVPTEGTPGPTTSAPVVENITLTPAPSPMPSPRPTMPRPTPLPVPLANLTTVTGGNVSQPAAMPTLDDEEVAEAPNLSPIDANVQDKNQKTQTDKNDKNNAIDPEDDEGGATTVSRIQGAEATSDAVAVVPVATTDVVSSLLALVFAWFV